METTSNPHQFKIFKHHHIKDMIRRYPTQESPRHENITHKKLNRVESPYFEYAIILITKKNEDTKTPLNPLPLVVLLLSLSRHKSCQRQITKYTNIPTSE